jgi:hypothetical protein
MSREPLRPAAQRLAVRPTEAEHERATDALVLNPF